MRIGRKDLLQVDGTISLLPVQGNKLCVILALVVIYFCTLSWDREWFCFIIYEPRTRLCIVSSRTEYGYCSALTESSSSLGITPGSNMSSSIQTEMA